MGFRFKKASAVAVGTFNIYVINPKWMNEVELVESGLGIRMHTDVRRPGFRFVIDGNSISWNVRPEMLLLESEEPDADCGVVLAKVLEILKWTPIRGIGTNIEYSAGREVLNELPEHCFRACPLPPECEKEQLTWHAAFKVDSRVINIQLCDRRDDVQLLINIHTGISEKENEITQVNANQIAVEAAKAFSEHKKDALSKVAHVLKIEL